MNYIINLIVLLFCVNLNAQKKFNFGLSLGSEQFFGKNKGFSPINYRLKNEKTYKLGVFVEKNLKNNDQILVGFNYNYYWNYFDYMNGEVPWYSGTSNTFYDIDIQYGRFLTNHFKVFLGTNVSYFRFHDKYYGAFTLKNGTLYASEINDVTDFNLALNTGVKYVINPKSKIKIEPFILVGATLFKRDNFKVNYYIENTSSNHYYQNIYTSFGLNIKY